MSTITVILEPDATGTLHLPVPSGMRHGKVQVTAILTPVPDTGTPPVADRRKHAFDALRRIAARGGLSPFRDQDPVSWQRETRRDRQLPGRE
ncbi:hypothetical protein OPIT5_14545 [Opitutaceae bacterium TAV5]|nr:hypothetical protein OPIT5_14545 [Opitutaceae bacterium TAV5]